MKLTRKLAALAMAVLLAVSLTACSPKEWAQNVVVNLVHKLGLVEESDEEDTDTTTKAPAGGSVEFPAEMDTDSARVVTYPVDDTLYVSFNGIANRVAKQLEEMVGVEARAVVPGHVQRGGSPSAYDRMLSTVFGVHAAQLIAAENYGQAVAMVGNAVSHNPLSEVAGKTKFVPADAQAVRAARSMGISLGD